MAKCVITIEDREDGKVNTSVEPSYSIIRTMAENNSKDLTPAHAYALRCMRAMIEMSRNNREEEQRDSRIIL